MNGENEMEELLEFVKSSLNECLDEENKYQSLKRLEKVLAALDYDDFDGLEDIEAAIEDYRGVEKEGMIIEEYHDEKDSAFEEIGNTVESVELSDVWDEEE